MLRYVFIMIVAFSFPSKANDMIIINQKEFEQLNLLQKTNMEIRHWKQSNSYKLHLLKHQEEDFNLALVKTIILD